jgi:NTE family protein
MIYNFAVKYFPLCIVLSLASLAAPQGLHGQPIPATRPKIGVALEGGGALGLAHIGVLEWLEDQHIPVDYIAGTSMGGLVGGMYATGMQPAEIRNLVTSIDWGETIAGQTPFQALSYRRKEDQRAFQNSLEFGLKNGFSLPGGLTSGQSVTFLLDRETLAYSGLKDFNELPIPFRCVATDLVTGKSHVFQDGPLGEALRATMSLPAVFNPIKTNGSIYADGGLLNNLPVDVVKQMGADIVIAISLSAPGFQAGTNPSMLSVMDRSMSVMIMANELRSMEKADLVVSVDLTGYSSSDYKPVQKIISRGFAAADSKTKMLSRLTVDDAAWSRYMDRRESRRIPSAPIPSFVKVTGVDDRSSRAIEQALSAHVGKPLNTSQLEHDINVISGIGRFSSFSYGMAESDGKRGLEVAATEKPYGPPFLNLGFIVDGGDLDNVQFTANARITAMDVGGFRSEWRTDISAGSTWGLSSEYYRPLSATSQWFVSPRVVAISNPFDLYDRSTRLAEYRIRQAGSGFDLGYAIDRFSELRLGYDVGYLETSLRVGDPVLPSPSGRVGVTSIRYALNRLDSPIVPRSGEAVQFRAQWDDASPGASKGFPLSELYFGLVRKVSKRGSVYVQGFGGSTFGYHDTGLPQFFLGGPGRLGAYGANELRADQYWLGRVGYLHELFRMPPLLGSKVYFTSAYELGKAYGAPGESGLPNDAAVGFVTETFAGPLFVGGSWGDSGHRKVYFTLGRFF